MLVQMKNRAARWKREREREGRSYSFSGVFYCETEQEKLNDKSDYTQYDLDASELCDLGPSFIRLWTSYGQTYDALQRRPYNLILTSGTSPEHDYHDLHIRVWEVRDNYRWVPWIQK